MTVVAVDAASHSLPVDIDGESDKALASVFVGECDPMGIESVPSMGNEHARLFSSGGGIEGDIPFERRTGIRIIYVRHGDLNCCLSI